MTPMYGRGLLGVVEAVADDEAVFDGEAEVVDGDLHARAAGFVQQQARASRAAGGWRGSQARKRMEEPVPTMSSTMSTSADRRWAAWRS